MRYSTIETSCFTNEKDAKFFNSFSLLLAKADTTAKVCCGKAFKIAFESLLFKPFSHAPIQWCMTEFSKQGKFFSQFKKFITINLGAVKIENGKFDLRVLDYTTAQKQFIAIRDTKIFRHDFYSAILNYTVESEKPTPKLLTAKIVLTALNNLFNKYDCAKLEQELLGVLDEAQQIARKYAE